MSGVLWRRAVHSGTMGESAGVRSLQRSPGGVRVHQAGRVWLGRLIATTGASSSSRLTLESVSGDGRTRAHGGAHRLGLVLALVLVSWAFPAVSFAANAANPHVPASVTSANCPQCHDPHQAAVGGNILRGVLLRMS